METTANRMRKAMILRGLKQIDLVNLTGIGRSGISQYLSGNFKPKQDKLFSIAGALNVNPAWLMGYDVPMEPINTPQPSNGIDLSKYDNIRPIELRKFPMLGEIACGEPITCNQEYETFFEATSDIKADFCLIAKGDSMINTHIFDGDIVFIRKQSMVENGEIAAVVIENEATLKRVYFYKEENKLLLVAENPQYTPLVYANDELDTINILGKAVAHLSLIK